MTGISGFGQGVNIGNQSLGPNPPNSGLTQIDTLLQQLRNSADPITQGRILEALDRETGSRAATSALIEGSGDGRFEVTGARTSVTFTPGGTGITVDAIIQGRDDPQFLLNMATSFQEQGIPKESVIADIRSELAALPPAERNAAAQTVYNALNIDNQPVFMRLNGSVLPLTDLANAFNEGIGNAMIRDGQIFDRSDIRNPMNHSVHIVKPGETLGQLARAHPAMTAGYLARENGIANPDQLRAGQTILLPTAAFVDRDIRSEFLLNSFANSEIGAAMPTEARNFDPATGINPAVYGRFGSMEGLQAATRQEYQRLVDVGYALGVRRYDAGELPAGLNRNQAIGTFMDDFARQGMRRWMTVENIEQGHDSLAQVFVNRRLYDPNGLNFRIPDLRVGGQYFDASLELKSETTQQIQDFYRYGNPDTVTIVRPTQLGGVYDVSDARVR
jgi:LysM repeat protein